MNRLSVVVGGLYGSEAKGHVVQRLVSHDAILQDKATLNIRVGGPNAGHTGHDNTGKPWALRQIPIGAVVSSRTPIALEIAAGSEVDLPVLLGELDALADAGMLEDKTVYVHGEATLIEQEHKNQESELVGRIGSTGKGIGAARAARLLRTATRVIDSSMAMAELSKRGVQVVVGDGAEWRRRYTSTVVEGVQGYALGLHAGFYPQCTTSDCRAIDFLAMAGISPWAYDSVTPWVVARVFPIRVAGNSGPMKGETSWEALGLDPEFTTVTKKQRRVGESDWDLVRQAVYANGGPRFVKLALSMVDQVYPEVKGLTYKTGTEPFETVERFLRSVEALTEAPIGLVMTGPNTAGWRDW